MDNDITLKLLDKLESIRSEISLLRVLLEKHQGNIETHERDIKELNVIVERVAEAQRTCPARKKFESHSIVIKDVIGLSGLVAAVIALLKVFGKI